MKLVKTVAKMVDKIRILFILHFCVNCEVILTKELYLRFLMQNARKNGITFQNKGEPGFRENKKSVTR
jgi:hypothetical protein